MEFPTNLDAYEKLLIRMSKPRVMIDNAACSTATLVMIDSARKHGNLLEIVQILTDLNLSIKKAYISCDGRWFMDVFHVTDLDGNKLTDDSVLSYIEQSLETADYGKSQRTEGLTALELTGTDRVGLLSEVFAVLSSLHCNVVDAEMWTHNGRIASLIYLTDDDYAKLSAVEGMLRNVLKGDSDNCSAKISVSLAVTRTERRLHQMMFADRDYERKTTMINDSPVVSVQNYLQKDYSVVNVHCKDRTKLLFDFVCALTDMEYVVYHATVDTSRDTSSMEFFIKHMNGTTISSEVEKHHVIVCLQAAIERRTSKGVRLELSTFNRKGLLAEVTWTFRENGLNVTRAEISTTMETALDIFYVTDAVGNAADPKNIESVRQKIGLSDLKVKDLPLICHRGTEKDEPTRMSSGGAMLHSLGSLVRRNLYNLGLIKSCS